MQELGGMKTNNFEKRHTRTITVTGYPKLARVENWKNKTSGKVDEVGV